MIYVNENINVMKSLKNKKNLIKRINVLSEILLIFAMYWLATFLRYVLPYGKAFSILDSVQFVILALVFTTSMVLVTYLSGAYFTFHIEGILSELAKVAASTFVGIAADCVIIYIFRLEQFSRVLLFYFAVLSFVSIFIKRIVVDKLIKYYDKKYEVKSSVLMIGSGRTALIIL